MGLQWTLKIIESLYFIFNVIYKDVINIVYIIIRKKNLFDLKYKYVTY